MAHLSLSASMAPPLRYVGIVSRVTGTVNLRPASSAAQHTQRAPNKRHEQKTWVCHMEVTLAMLRTAQRRAKHRGLMPPLLLSTMPCQELGCRRSGWLDTYCGGHWAANDGLVISPPPNRCMHPRLEKSGGPLADHGGPHHSPSHMRRLNEIPQEFGGGRPTCGSPSLTRVNEGTQDSSWPQDSS
jgi:hypothetical protein